MTHFSDVIQKSEGFDLIPSWLGEILFSGLLKGAGHKYVRRIPTGNPKRPWKYYYNVKGGGGVAHDDEIKVGAAFKVTHGGEEGHFHITAVDGDKVTIRHDESGHVDTMSKAAFSKMVRDHHAEAIRDHHEKLRADWKAVQKHGSEKQKGRIQDELRKYGVEGGEDKAEAYRHIPLQQLSAETREKNDGLLSRESLIDAIKDHVSRAKTEEDRRHAQKFIRSIPGKGFGIRGDLYVLAGLSRGGVLKPKAKAAPKDPAAAPKAPAAAPTVKAKVPKSIAGDLDYFERENYDPDAPGGPDKPREAFIASLGSGQWTREGLEYADRALDNALDIMGPGEGYDDDPDNPKKLRAMRAFRSKLRKLRTGMGA